MESRLLTVAAVVECIAGLAFFVLPGPIIALLLGAEPHVQGEMIGRIAGVALMALGVACGGAAVDTGGAARTATLGAIALYNAGAGALLLLFAATGKAIGPVAWVVGALHAFGGVLGFNAVIRRRAHRLA